MKALPPDLSGLTRSEVERVSLFVSDLHQGGARREPEARATLGRSFQVLLQQRVLKVGYGLLGPVVTLDQGGFQLLDQPGKFISATQATEQVAWREAIMLAMQQGYEVMSFTSTYLRLKNVQGQHVMYVRVSRNPPSPESVAALIKYHRPSLKRERGTLIVVVQDDQRFTYQLQRQPLLQVWALQ